MREYWAKPSRVKLFANNILGFDWMLGEGVKMVFTLHIPEKVNVFNGRRVKISEALRGALAIFTCPPGASGICITSCEGSYR